MIVARSLNELARDKNSVVTVGTFDGVHRAHREIVREVVKRARSYGGRSVVVTFEPHPKEVVASAKGPVSLLTTMEERIELLGEMEIGVLLIVEFTYEFSRLTSREFYRRYVVEGTGVREVVVGYDHTFGRDREGDIEIITQLGREFDFTVHRVPQYAIDGESVSSTRIRHALREGNVERATKFLGHPYTLQGEVVPGDGRGKSIGYRTANVAPVSLKKVIPGRGVYLAGIRMEGRQLYGMLNIGVRPTVTDGVHETIEVHIFDFAEQIYGRVLGLSFLSRLRDERKFASVSELRAQLDSDREAALRSLEKFEGHNSRNTSQEDR